MAVIIKPIDEATSLQWKQETVDYLNTKIRLPESMGIDLIRNMKTVYRPKGYLLLNPDMLHKTVYFLKKGMAKLYVIDEFSGKQMILYIWLAGEVIVMYNMFRHRLENVKYYIELLDDASLVSLSNDHMDLIYESYAVAERLTSEILAGKTERRMLHMQILGMTDKAARYHRFVELFPEFCYKLNMDDICAFLGITLTTLKESRKKKKK